MFGYFGQAYFGGQDSNGTITPGTPSGTPTLAADAATIVDTDTTVAGLGQDDAASTSDSAIATGLGVGTDVSVSDDATVTDAAVAVGLDAAPPPPPEPPDTTLASNIRFVDGASASAQIRMDLDAGYWRALFDGTDAALPGMDDMRVSSMFSDGEYIAASAYRNRTIKLTLLLDAPNAATAATEIQKLQRELDRDTNVLQWQPNVNLPSMYFFTYRGPDVTSNLDWGLQNHRFELDIEAEPFAIGDPVTSNVTVNADPAVVSNPGYFDMSDVKGDAPTPLYITTTAAQVGSGALTAWAVRRHGTPANVRWYRRADDTGLTLGVDAARVTGRPDTGSGTTVRVTFATTTASALRLSGVFPYTGSGSVDWRGLYRVFVRAASTGTVRMQVATGTDTASRGQRVLLDPNGIGPAYSVTDLGLVQLPVGNVGRRAGYGSEHAASGSLLYFYAEQASSGTLEIDWIRLVPTDECYGLAAPPTWSGGSGAGCAFDGVANETYARNSAGELAHYGTRVPYVDGQLPEVSPTAAVNRVFMVPGIDAASAVANASAISLQVTYWPRYLLARPVST